MFSDCSDLCLWTAFSFVLFLYYYEQVEEVNSLMDEVADITSKERSLLSECKGILSTLAATQVTLVPVVFDCCSLQASPGSPLLFPLYVNVQIAGIF